ncbi:winged helix-turn-helix transcriptional regulator [Sphingobacterium gobiense]
MSTVEYSLTEKGRDLHDIVFQIRIWSEKHL